MKIISAPGFRSVWILTISCALAGSIMTLMPLLGSLVGADLAPHKEWATLPIALMILGTAVAVIPVTLCMRALGRKKALWLFMGVAIFCCWLAIISLQQQSFILFCSASLLLGSTNAALLQTRFAAMESVNVDDGPTAASMVMCGGIIAAFTGPELAVLGMHLTAVPYQGSFALAAASIAVAAVLLVPFRPVPVCAASKEKNHTSAIYLLRNRSFFLALTCSATAYAVMSFLMTGTPISMHHFHSHSLLDTKWVIQSHIAAMFLPSFVAPLLFRRFGIRGMMVIGLFCYCTALTIGFADTSVRGFWSQLVLLGVGWNFLFVAGTSLLATSHCYSDRFKAQAINDFTTFSFQATAALSAGWAINLISWQQMLLICLLPIVLMLTVIVWERSALH